MKCKAGKVGRLPDIVVPIIQRKGPARRKLQEKMRSHHPTGTSSPSMHNLETSLNISLSSITHSPSRTMSPSVQSPEIIIPSSISVAPSTTVNIASITLSSTETSVTIFAVGPFFLQYQFNKKASFVFPFEKILDLTSEHLTGYLYSQDNSCSNVTLRHNKTPSMYETDNYHYTWITFPLIGEVTCNSSVTSQNNIYEWQKDAFIGISNTEYINELKGRGYIRNGLESLSYKETYSDKTPENYGYLIANMKTLYISLMFFNFVNYVI